MMKICLNCIWCDMCNPGCDCSVTKKEMKQIAATHSNAKCSDYSPIYGNTYTHSARYKDDFVSQWYEYLEDNINNFY